MYFRDQYGTLLFCRGGSWPAESKKQDRARLATHSHDFSAALKPRRVFGKKTSMATVNEGSHAETS